MKIDVIGAGNIGGTIGASWEKAGHDVTYQLRDPEKKTGAVPLGQDLHQADAVLLALPGRAVVDFVRSQAKALDGKILIDATNNFGAPSFNSWHELLKLVPDAELYRAFNSLGADVFQNPQLGGEKADLFYCGPENDAPVVERLIEDVGLRPIRVGGMDEVDTVDGVLRLWYTLAQSRGRRIAFRLISD